MPTFKADFFEYDSNLTAEGNIQNLINRYNELVQRLTKTVNNLDEDNLNIDLIAKKGEEDDG